MEGNLPGWYEQKLPLWYVGFIPWQPIGTRGQLVRPL